MAKQVHARGEMKSAATRRKWLAYGACAFQVACAGARSSPGTVKDGLAIVGDPFSEPVRRLVIPVPRGWVMRQVSDWFEGTVYAIGPEDEQCEEIRVDFYGGVGLGTCGAARTTDTPGSLFGAPVTWRTGPIPLGSCGKALWSRALLPGIDTGGISLVARAHDRVEEIRRIVSGMRIQDGKKLDAGIERHERWSFEPRLCNAPN